jgi:hypothetical protein
MKTLTGKVITAPGVKPTVSVKWGRENFWIYGAIEPFTGDHFFHEYPKLNGDYFQEFLDWLSQELGEDYAILQIDSAPAHINSAISWPENIIHAASTASFSRTAVGWKARSRKGSQSLNFF